MIIIICLKEKSKTALEIFCMDNCNNCSFKNDDAFFWIGYRVVGIYHIKECSQKTNKLLINNKKMEKILWEIILYDNVIRYMFLEDVSNLDRYYKIFEAFLNDGMDVQIIVY